MCFLVLCVLSLVFWFSSFDLLVPVSFLNVSLTFSLPPSLFWTWGSVVGFQVKSSKTEDECGEVKESPLPGENIVETMWVLLWCHF